jgi:hypothetical protein
MKGRCCPSWFPEHRTRTLNRSLQISVKHCSQSEQAGQRRALGLIVVDLLSATDAMDDLTIVEIQIQSRAEVFHGDGLIRPQIPRRSSASGCSCAFKQVGARRLINRELCLACVAAAGCQRRCRGRRRGSVASPAACEGRATRSYDGRDEKPRHSHFINSV